MVKHKLAAVLIALSAVAAAPPVRLMYADAMAKEQAVRKALAAPDASDAMLKAVRDAVASYEAVARRYPASSYSDNALWQAAHLALDAYTRFNQTADRDAAARLLRKLEVSYPSSRLARQVRDELAKIDVDAPALPARTSAPPPAPTPTTSTTTTSTTTATATTTAPAATMTSAGPAASVTTNATLVTIKNIRRSVLADAVRVIIELDGEVTFHQERIPDPWRVFVDLPGTRASAQVVDRTMRFESDADIVRQVRVGRHPNNTTRVVLDAAGVSSYSVYPLYDPYRLVIDCVRESATTTTTTPAAAATTTSTTTTAPTTQTTTAPRPPAPAAAAVPKPMAAALPKPVPPIVHRDPPVLPSRPTTQAMLRAAPSNTPRHGILLAEAHVAERVVRPPAPATSTASIAKVAESLPAAPPPAAAPPAARNTTGLSIARQLGLGVSRIVIDPGHGGHDSGAKGKGVVESELVLDIALRVEKLLQKVPGVEVILTRRGDDFIELPERTAMANREGADLFLSIHANASTSALAHGIETYYLNFATNLSAAAVAARENANSTQAMGSLPDFVKAIALNNKVDESRDFANHVQSAMLEKLRPTNKTVKDLGVKQAPFVVLIGAVMPSVLAEISFVTNTQEARLLKNNAYRQKIAEALFGAIRKYQTSLKSITTIATQR